MRKLRIASHRPRLLRKEDKNCSLLEKQFGNMIKTYPGLSPAKIVCRKRTEYYTRFL
jgi:hypothetical protein